MRRSEVTDLESEIVRGMAGFERKKK